MNAGRNIGTVVLNSMNRHSVATVATLAGLIASSIITYSVVTRGVESCRLINEPPMSALTHEYNAEESRNRLEAVKKGALEPVEGSRAGCYTATANVGVFSSILGPGLGLAFGAFWRRIKEDYLSPP